MQRAAHSAQHARARTHAGTGWFNHAARVLVWPSVQCVHVRILAERRECQLVWPCPPALEARRRPPPAPQASPAWQLPECHEHWRSVVRLHLIGTCLTTRLTSYRNLALYCLWPEEGSGGHLEGHRRAELRSLGRHFSARRRSRSAGCTAASTGRYWMVRPIVYHGCPCSCRSCRTAFFMPDPRRAQPGVEMALFGARSFPHGPFERR